MPLNEPLRAEAPPRALAPLLGTQPAPRPAAAHCRGPPPRCSADRWPRPQPAALSGQPAQARQQRRRHAPARAQGAAAIQQSIARIHEASQAPPLSPPEYRVLFDVMAQEISRQRPDRRADAGQHRQARARARPRGPPRRRALRARGRERGRSVVRAGRLGRTCSPAASATSSWRAAAARASTCRPTSSI